jgi:hypothetical protein
VWTPRHQGASDNVRSSLPGLDITRLCHDVRGGRDEALDMRLCQRHREACRPFSRPSQPSRATRDPQSGIPSRPADR